MQNGILGLQAGMDVNYYNSPRFLFFRPPWLNKQEAFFISVPL
jgi:hypothetical protein